MYSFSILLFWRVFRILFNFKRFTFFVIYTLNTFQFLFDFFSFNKMDFSSRTFLGTLMMLRFSNGQKSNKTFLYIFLHEPSPVIKGSLVINSKYPISNYNFIISISNSIFVCLYILHKYKFLFIN